MKNALFTVFLLALFSCQPPSPKKKKAEESKVDPKILVSCEGIGEVKLTDDYASLEKKFGANALSIHDNNVYGKYTALWEGKPNQINIFWKEKAQPFKHIRYMETSDPNSPYMTADSLRVGLSMPDIVRRNGFMPLTFNNFYVEDEGGLITSFNNGDLPKKNPCFEGLLEWVSQANIYKKDYDAFKKRKVVESSDRIFDHMEVMLGRIRVSAK